MPFFAYLLVLLVTAGSVLFGLDWLTAPLPPLPKTAVHVTAVLPPALPVQQQTVSSGKTEPVSVAAPAPLAATAPIQPPPAPVTSAAPPAAETAVSAKCDINACARAYHSFNAEDCTYQPSQGPRRLCTKHSGPAADRAEALGQAPEPASAASCNIAACARAYSSFDASDCTYQPYDGPRRRCAR